MIYKVNKKYVSICSIADKSSEEIKTILEDLGFNPGLGDFILIAYLGEGKHARYYGRNETYYFSPLLKKKNEEQLTIPSTWSTYTTTTTSNIFTINYSLLDNFVVSA